MFRFSEKPTKTLRNLPLSFDVTPRDATGNPRNLFPEVPGRFYIPSKLKERLCLIFAAFSEHLNFNEILSKFFED